MLYASERDNSSCQNNVRNAQPTHVKGDLLLVSGPECKALSYLRKVHVHLVTVKIGVVRLAVGVVHTQRLLLSVLQHSHAVGHN